MDDDGLPIGWPGHRLYDPDLKPQAETLMEGIYRHLDAGDTHQFEAWYATLPAFEQSFVGLHLWGMTAIWDEELDTHIKEVRYEFEPATIDEAITESLAQKARAEEYLLMCRLSR